MHTSSFQKTCLGRNQMMVLPTWDKVLRISAYFPLLLGITILKKTKQNKKPAYLFRCYLVVINSLLEYRSWLWKDMPCFLTILTGNKYFFCLLKKKKNKKTAQYVTCEAVLILASASFRRGQWLPADHLPLQRAGGLANLCKGTGKWQHRFPAVSPAARGAELPSPPKPPSLPEPEASQPPQQPKTQEASSARGFHPAFSGP